ncbi:MAG: DnaA regulatory inactivator Hda [Thiothrix sp.]|nr:MAG: DnaA regulatory inactivator Hda [Thiothrix sp.]
MKQLPLPIQLDTQATLGNYIAGANLQTVNCLSNLLGQSPEIQVFIWSREERGKTHLLQSLTRLAGDNNKVAAYFPMEQFQDMNPEILDNLDRLKLVCIDDVDKVCNRPDWAEALFHLINRCRAKLCPLVFSASQNPQSMPVALPDLASRFLWGQVFHIKPLEDNELERFLNARSKECGLDMPAEVLRYLMQRSRRDVGVLLKQVEKLDEEALVRQRRITVPFTKEVLDL